MTAGWVCIHRQITDWEWYRDGNTFRLFMHLLLTANHKPNKWRGITVERGQLIVGRQSLSAQTGISEQSIRTSLDKLKSTSEVTIKSTSRYTILTICNYEAYQQYETEINQQLTSKLTNNQPATNQQLTTNNNGNNENNGTKSTYSEIQQNQGFPGDKKPVKSRKSKSQRYQLMTNPEKIDKILFMECVFLTEDEHKKLINLFGEEGVRQRIESLNDGIMSKGYKYKSHYHTILSWERRNGKGSGAVRETVEHQAARLRKEMGEVL